MELTKEFLDDFLYHVHLEDSKWISENFRSELINYLNDEGRSIVALASFGSTSFLQFILDLGFNPNVAQNGEQRPLFYAIVNKELSKVKLLIKYGACPDFFFGVRDTPIHYCCREGYFHILKVILKKNDSILRTFDYLLMTPLMAAAANNHLKVTEYLISCGSEVNQQSYSGETALDLANHYKNKDICNYLVKCGADKNKYP